MPSESYDGLVGLAWVWSSLNVLLPELVNQLQHVEGIAGSKVSCGSHVVHRSCSVSVVLHPFHFSVTILDFRLMCEQFILGRIHGDIAEHVDVITKVTH